MLKVSESSPNDVPADATSAIGHAETATVLSELLNREVRANRVALSLEKGDSAFVATLFTQEGRPFRPPEGVVLTADELRQLRVAIRRVDVL